MPIMRVSISVARRNLLTGGSIGAAETAALEATDDMLNPPPAQKPIDRRRY
jgi:hypothetical protein